MTERSYALDSNYHRVMCCLYKVKTTRQVSVKYGVGILQQIYRSYRPRVVATFHEVQIELNPFPQKAAHLICNWYTI
jgi:hypothetical protein